MPQKSLDESRALFIRRWGEMAGYWGISRTMAEIHALLYVSTEPVCTDDVMALLQVSRGNASMNLRSLLDWGLIERVHRRGDRKEYFTALTDVWQMFETIARQRRRREVEPIMETLDRCRDMARKGLDGQKGDDVAATKSYLSRLDDMDRFLRALGAMADLLMKVGPKGLADMSGLMIGLMASNAQTAAPAKPAVAQPAPAASTVRRASRSRRRAAASEKVAV